MKAIIGSTLLALLLACQCLLPSKPRDLLNPFVSMESGSGVVIRSWGDEDHAFCYVLTCYHVISDDLKSIPAYFVRFDERGGTLNCYKAVGRIVDSNEFLDYAIVRYETIGRQDVTDSIKRSDAFSWKILDEVIAVGRPRGEPVWLSKGVISAVERRFKGIEHIGHDAKIYFGNSGGPLYSHGILIGINSGVARRPPTWDDKPDDVLTFIGFAIPLGEIYADLGPIKTSRYFGFVLDSEDKKELRDHPRR